MGKKDILKRLFLGGLFLLMNFVSFAQPVTAAEGSDGGDDPCFETECIPIDSGIVFLLLAGSLLAIRLMYTFHKSRA
ncbi:MAG: hypothetical protein WDZ35_13190 [Crocinitomicaceae bacterium]